MVTSGVAVKRHPKAAGGTLRYVRAKLEVIRYEFLLFCSELVTVIERGRKRERESERELGLILRGGNSMRLLYWF